MIQPKHSERLTPLREFDIAGRRTGLWRHASMWSGKLSLWVKEMVRLAVRIEMV